MIPKKFTPGDRVKLICPETKIPLSFPPVGSLGTVWFAVRLGYQVWFDEGVDIPRMVLVRTDRLEKVQEE